MRCLNCGRIMQEFKGDYRYKESGLRNIVLKNITMVTCECGEEGPMLPAIKKIHRDIVLELVKKKALLTCPEIRFLRLEMELKATDFAKMLGVTKVTVSRWQTGEKPIGQTNDKLIRVLSIEKLKAKSNDHKLNKLDLLAGLIAGNYPVASQAEDIFIDVKPYYSTADVGWDNAVQEEMAREYSDKLQESVEDILADVKLKGDMPVFIDSSDNILKSGDSYEFALAA